MRFCAALLVLLAASVLGCASSTGSAGRGGGESCAWRVCLSYTDLPSGRLYEAVNREPVPATVVLDFHSVTNLRPPPGGQVAVVVPADSSITVSRLRKIRSGEPVGARIALSIDLGASDTAEDAHYLYASPFGGRRPRELVQGYGGTGSHMASMYYSLDFAMPEGTPVVAARGGIVLWVQDWFTEGGTDPELLDRANVVVIAHSDGTMAFYGHLRPGAVVDRGDVVEEGDLLGWSGSTGFSGQPHLHFHVGKRLLGEPGHTIPVLFRDPEGRPMEPDVGEHMEPAGIVDGRWSRRALEK